MGYLTRRSSAWRACAAALSFLVTAAAACGVTAGAAEAGNAQAARWVQRTIRFTYLGITTHYSCEGLRDEVRLILLELGARKHDLSVHELGCTAPFGGPEPFPAVAGTFYALQPVPQQQPGGSGAAAVAAHWQTVQVRLDRSPVEEAGQCELLEQAKQRIVPLFDTRNVRFHSECTPHQLTIPGATLEVDVLKPDGEGPGKAAGEN